jgi:hypothetical protein
VAWNPNRAQWRIIWLLAAVLILSWPAADGSSLGVKTLRWLADPNDSLPRLPDPLPMGLGDDGDAVAAHDEQTAEYYRLTEGSPWIRQRLKIKELADPLEPATQRQVVAGIGILGALAVWRLNTRRNGGTS